jgi:hypothetical protein
MVSHNGSDPAYGRGMGTGHPPGAYEPFKIEPFFTDYAYNDLYCLRQKPGSKDTDKRQIFFNYQVEYSYYRILYYVTR